MMVSPTLILEGLHETLVSVSGSPGMVTIFPNVTGLSYPALNQHSLRYTLTHLSGGPRCSLGLSPASCEESSTLRTGGGSGSGPWLPNQRPWYVQPCLF